MQQVAQEIAPISNRTPTSIPGITPSILDRLAAYSILPPGHETMQERELGLIEQLFITWYEMTDDESRRASIPYLFGTQDEVRRTLLAIVPLYFDPLFFDEHTPTRELVTLALAAHTKWRAWLDGSRC
jgi:hypothetical protein